MALSIIATVTVNWSQICNAITGSLEGGYSMWMHSFKYIPASTELAAKSRGGEHTVWYNDPEFWTNGGVALCVFDKADESEGSGTGRMEIDQHKLTEGVALMAQKQSRHFGDLVNENDDADTHDVLMQMVVFGDVIYG